MRKLLLGLLFTAAAGIITIHAQEIPTPIQGHIYDMAGHLGLLMVDCGDPEPLGSAEGELCFTHTPENTERFMREWDLYYDWDARVSYTATAIQPWEASHLGTVSRPFLIGPYLYLVSYFPEGAHGFVYILYGEVH